MAKPLWESQYDFEQFIAGNPDGKITDFNNLTPEQQKIFEKATGNIFNKKGNNNESQTPKTS